MASSLPNYFVNARPDDHFFMVASLPMMAINQYLYRQLGYDPETDLKPIGLIAQTPNVIVASPALKVHTLKELAEYAKAHPKPTRLFELRCRQYRAPVE